MRKVVRVGIYAFLMLFCGLVVFAQRNNNENFKSKLYEKKNGLYKANVMMAFEYEKEGKKQTLFKRDYAVIELEADKNAVYDSAYISYIVKDKKVTLHYKTYALANALSLTINNVKYEISSIDGGCDMVIANLDYQYKTIGNKEFLFLNITDDLRLEKEKTSGKEYIVLKKGGFFIFDIDI